MSDSNHLVGITACPSGVAHTYLAAESLQAAATELGYTMDVETHGSIGVENELSADSIARAEAVVIAADKAVDLSRFAGKKVVTARAAEGIHKPQELIRKALAATPLAGASGSAAPSFIGPRAKTGMYGVLMNGVSHMIPFVVTGGLLLAVAFGFGGVPGPTGLVIPEGTVYETMMKLGALGFSLMVPILSGFIAYAIADRPGLAPGMITGMLAVTPAIYGSSAGAGFLGGILTGLMSGYLALWIKNIKVHQYIRPIMPIIIIPVVTTVVVSALFIYVLGKPIAGIFAALTTWLAGMTGANAIALGLIMGAMIGFDMGGPVNKVAYMTAAGLIATGNTLPAGLVGVAIAVPPMGMALASFVGRRYFTDAERQNGIAAIFMGFFGITEGAIPFAAARPLQVIPANVIGAAVGGAVAGFLGVHNNVPWGGLIVVAVGAVPQALAYIFSLAVGCVATAAIAIGLIAVTGKPDAAADAVLDAAEDVDAGEPVGAPVAAVGPSIRDYLSVDTISLDGHATERDDAIRALVGLASNTGHVVDAEGVVAAAIKREGEFSTAVGHGIAIPHAKTDAVSAPIVAFLRNGTGIDWKSSSGDPATLLFLIAVPESAAGNEHLRILAKLSRALAKPEFREGLAKARSADAVYDLVSAYVGT